MPRKNKQIKHKRLVVPNVCMSKKQYSSERLALETAEYQMLINYDLQLAVYRCDVCQKWHLTRRQDSNKL